MVDFSEFLSKPVGEIKEVLLPIGHYAGSITKHEPKESAGTGGKPKRPMYMVEVTLQSAYEDAEATGQLPASGVVGLKRSTNFILDADFGLVQLRKMMESAGIEMDESVAIGEYLDQLDNRPVRIFIDHRPRDKDNPEAGMVEDIKKFLPVQ